VRVYIDKGHGENGDPGAVSGALVERDMNIVYGNAIAERLSSAGWEVKLEGGTLSINENAAAANAFDADILLSCHINAGGGDRGEVIFSVRPGSEQLANAVVAGLKAAGQTTVRTYTKLNSRGVDYFGILRLSNMPAVIVEPFFLDNAADREIGDTKEKLWQLGHYIADALIAAYGGEIQKGDDEEVKRYQRLSDIPNDFGFRDIIEKLMNAKIINGDGSDPAGNNDVIDLSHDQVRSLVFEYRGGAFDRKLISEGMDPAVKI
jgi:N-acetylmuramoyl-L-alanine amidase